MMKKVISVLIVKNLLLNIIKNLTEKLSQKMNLREDDDDQPKVDPDKYVDAYAVRDSAKVKKESKIDRLRSKISEVIRTEMANALTHPVKSSKPVREGRVK